MFRGEEFAPDQEENYLKVFAHSGVVRGMLRVLEQPLSKHKPPMFMCIRTPFLGLSTPFVRMSNLLPLKNPGYATDFSDF